jgi:hypothetical protein
MEEEKIIMIREKERKWKKISDSYYRSIEN